MIDCPFVIFNSKDFGPSSQYCVRSCYHKEIQLTILNFYLFFFVIGRGAWQNWSYQLSIENLEEGTSREIRGINTTWFTAHDLQPGTVYVLRAAAYTCAGVGPWSAPFRAKTLSARDTMHKGVATSIVWSASEGLLLSDPTGDTLHTIIHRDNLKVSFFLEFDRSLDQVNELLNYVNGLGF
jgi:hypothetical protein